MYFPEPNESKAPLEIEWSSMAEALMPHVDFPPQEGMYQYNPFRI